MESFIRALYLGNINLDTKDFEHNPQYGNAIKIISKNEGLLTGLLTGNEQQLFLDLVNAWGDVLDISSCETFVDGFRIGAAFILDTFVKTGYELKKAKEG